MSWSVNALAARAVATHARNKSEARRLLDMLGLVTDDGQLAPDDTRVYAMTDPGTGRDPMLDNLTRRDPAAQAPAGLAVLTPVVQQPKPRKRKAKATPPKVTRTTVEGRSSQPKKARPVAKCGTRAGYQRHLRLKEPTCEACRVATNQYRRDYDNGKRRNRASPVVKLAPCGTKSAYDRHLRRGEVTDPECRAANAASQRELAARKRERKAS